MPGLAFIVIEGNIGAGKTTLATMLNQELKGRLILERFAENPFLPKFYENPSRWAFTLELSFLADRYKQLNEELIQPTIFDQYIIADYYFLKSLIFSKETLAQDEFNLYKQLFEIIYNNNIPKPDLFIYLNTPIFKLLDQIKKRGRPYEQNLSYEYLKRIHENYIEFIQNQKDIPIIVINTEHIDFVQNKKDFYKIKKIVLTEIKNKERTIKYFF